MVVRAVMAAKSPGNTAPPGPEATAAQVASAPWWVAVLVEALGAMAVLVARPLVRMSWRGPVVLAGRGDSAARSVAVMVVRAVPGALVVSPLAITALLALVVRAAWVASAPLLVAVMLVLVVSVVLVVPPMDTVLLLALVVLAAWVA